MLHFFIYKDSIAKSIYKGLIEEQKFGNRYSEPESGSVVRAVTGRDIDRYADLAENGIWVYEDEEDIKDGVTTTKKSRIKNMDAYKWVLTRLNMYDKGDLLKAKMDTLNDLTHILSIYFIYFILRDFCFQDILIENKDIVESIEYFINGVAVNIESEYDTLWESNKNSEFHGYSKTTFWDRHKKNNQKNIYYSLVVPDILRLLERLYYGEWVAHNDGELLCDYTTQSKEVLNEVGLVKVRNQFSAIPIEMDVSIVTLGSEIVDNNDIMILLSNIDKIVTNLHYVMSGVSVNAGGSSESVMRELEGLLCTLVRDMDEYKKIASIVIQNPRRDFIDILELKLRNTDKQDYVRIYVIKAVKQIFSEQIRAIKSSNPDSSRGEVRTVSNYINRNGMSLEELQVLIHTSVEGIVFYANKLGNFLENSQYNANMAEHDLLKPRQKTDSEKILQYNIIDHKEKNVLNQMIRMKSLPTFGYMTQGNVCTFDINVQLMRGVKAFIAAYDYFHDIKDLYDKYYVAQGGTGEVPAQDVSLKWLLEVADHPQRVLFNYAFIQPFVYPDHKNPTDASYVRIAKSISFISTLEMLHEVIKFKNNYPKFITDQLVDFEVHNVRSKKVITGFRLLLENSTAKELFFKLTDCICNLGDIYSLVSPVGYDGGILINDINEIADISDTDLRSKEQFNNEHVRSLGVIDAAGTNVVRSRLCTVANRERNDQMKGIFSSLSNFNINHLQYQVLKNESDMNVYCKGVNAESIFKGECKENFLRKCYVLYDTFNPTNPVISSRFSVMNGYVGEPVVKLYTVRTSQHSDTRQLRKNDLNGQTDYNQAVNNWSAVVRDSINSFYPKYVIKDIGLSYCKDVSYNFYPALDYDLNNIYVPDVSTTMEHEPPYHKNVYKLTNRQLVELARHFYIKREIISDKSTPPTMIPHTMEDIGIYHLKSIYDGVVQDIRMFNKQPNGSYILNSEGMWNVLDNLDLVSLLRLINQEVEYININSILTTYDLMLYLKNGGSVAVTSENNMYNYFVNGGSEFVHVPNMGRHYDMEKEDVKLPYIREIGFTPTVNAQVAHLNFRLEISLAAFDKLLSAKEYIPGEFRSKFTEETMSNPSETSFYKDIINSKTDLNASEF